MKKTVLAVLIAMFSVSAQAQEAMNSLAQEEIAISKKKKNIIFANTAEETRALIKEGQDVNTSTEYGFTPLMFANYEQAKLLIEAGANVHAADKGGWTVLIRASGEKKIKLLIDAGADVNATTNSGWTALMGVTTLKEAELLVKAGADVNARLTARQNGFDEGSSPLMTCKDKDIKKLLIKSGAKEFETVKSKNQDKEERMLQALMELEVKN